MKKPQRIVPLVVLYFLSLLTHQVALAATYTFNGAFNSNWSFSWNWPTGMPPNPIPAGDNVVLAGACSINMPVICNGSIGYSGSFPVTITSALTIGAGGVFTIANLTNNSTLTINGTFIPTTAFVNNSQVIINSVVNMSQMFTNNGTVTINSSGRLDLYRTATSMGSLVNNTGRNVIVNGQLSISQGSIFNQGNLSIITGGSLKSSTGSTIFNYSILSNGGTIDIGAGCLLNSNATINNQNGGTIEGNGAIQNDWLYNGNIGSNISPGNSAPGRLSIYGSSSWNLLGNTTYRCDINGTSPGINQDNLNFSGTVTLSSVSLVVNWGSFTPLSGQNFTIINCGNRVGQFASVIIPPVPGVAFSVIYNNNSVVIRATAVLPLTLAKFHGSLVSDNEVKLSWDVHDETQVHGYEIEISKDGISFQTIGFIKATNSTGIHSYTFQSTQEYNRSFYRLRMIDFDGKYSYSKILVLEKSEQHKVKLFPNPATDYITLTGLLEDGQIEISSLDGNELIQTRVSANSIERIDISRLVKGLYLLRYRSKSNKNSLIFIKQ